MSNSQRPISDSRRPLITDEQVLQMFGDSSADAFDVLSRQARKALSEDSVARMLLGAAPAPVSHDLPVAARVKLPPRQLAYEPARSMTAQLQLSAAPVGYRILRLGLWLGVAAAMIAVMAGTFLAR